MSQDPWKLLAEAREVVSTVAESGNKDWELLQTIDAALAAHAEDEQWRQIGTAWVRKEGRVWLEVQPTAARSVFTWRLLRRDLDNSPLPNGSSPTPEQAQEAALEAARRIS